MEKKFEFNKPTEVNRKEYLFLIKNFNGIVAHKKENNNFYIKIMLKKYVEEINKILR